MKNTFKLKREKQYSYIFIALVFLLCSSCKQSQDFPDVNAMRCLPKPELPISTIEEAICFAAYIEKISASLSEVQQLAKYNGWSVEANQLNISDWQVRIRSKGKRLPSYTCLVSFTERGKLIKTNGSDIDCRYNK